MSVVDSSYNAVYSVVMNVTTPERLRQVLSLTLEGVSGRAIRRLTGISCVTMYQYLKQVGAGAIAYQDRIFRNLPIKELQLDEMWTYVHGRKANLSPELKNRKGFGEQWIWIALDPQSKLLAHWVVGSRSLMVANVFIEALRDRVNPQVEIITDGFHAYLEAIDQKFLSANHRVAFDGFSPKTGEHTNHVERHNLTLRTNLSCLRRSSNTQSKDWRVLTGRLGLYSMHYNFCRVHGSLRVTPAMEIGLTDCIWSLEDMLVKCFEIGQTIITKNGQVPQIDMAQANEILETRFFWDVLANSVLRGTRSRKDHHRDSPFSISRAWDSPLKKAI